MPLLLPSLKNIWLNIIVISSGIPSIQNRFSFKMHFRCDFFLLKTIVSALKSFFLDALIPQPDLCQSFWDVSFQHSIKLHLIETQSEWISPGGWCHVLFVWPKLYQTPFVTLRFLIWEIWTLLNFTPLKCSWNVKQTTKVNKALKSYADHKLALWVTAHWRTRITDGIW